MPAWQKRHPRATTENFDGEAIVDDLGHRDELLLGIRPIGEVGDGALFDLLGHVGVPGSHGGEELAVVFDLYIDGT